MAAGPASHPTMLSVHIIPSHHDLLMDRPEASAARDSGIQEMLVVIHRGQIIATHTPPVDSFGGCFRSDDLWIVDEIRRAYEIGTSAGAMDQSAWNTALAPAGWSRWHELRPGDIATSGGCSGWIVISEDESWKFENGGCNALKFADEDAPGRNECFDFTPDAKRGNAWPFYRIVRRDVASEVMQAFVTAALDRDPALESVENVLDRILPRGS